MTEAFLQYVWQHQLLEGELQTTEGQSVVVERPGILNGDAGPDFFDARVRIGDTLWAGNLEVHVKSSDWNLHHHANDRAYDNVVLHVVYQCDTAITMHDAHTLPTVELKNNIAGALWDNYEALLHPPKEIPIPCMNRLDEVPAFIVDSHLERLTVERLERKCGRVREMLKDTRGNWEQCCYWMMAHYFGGRPNAFPFELLAKCTDLNLLSRWRDNPTRTEALLMGQAGLLEGCFEDEYPRRLQTDYQALSQGAGLTPMAGYLWKFYRLRPSSFPTLRISQFAALVCRSRNLFSHLLETPDAEELQKFFDVPASEYWNNHYRFDHPSPGGVKRLGKDFVNILIINAWVPLLFEYGNQHGQQQYKDQAVSILQQLPAEKNRVIRQWQSAGISALTAAQSQALLQLYNEHCTRYDCLNCPIGYRLIRS